MSLTADLKTGDRVIVVVHSTRTGKVVSRDEAKVIERTQAGYVRLADQRLYRWNGAIWTEKLTFKEAMRAERYNTLEEPSGSEIVS
jgi:hypothetical protein